MSDRANWAALAPVSGLQNDATNQPADGDALVWSEADGRYVPKAISSSGGGGTPTGTAGGDLAGTYPNPSLKTIGSGASAGSATMAPVITTDGKGRVIALSQVAITPTGSSPTGAAGGDLAGTYPNPSLAAIGSAVGPLPSSAARVPVVTVDTKGRVTALTDEAIAISYSQITSGAPTSLPPNGSAGGGLGGTYPNPSVTPAANLDTTAIHTGASAGGDLGGTYPNPTIAAKLPTGGVKFAYLRKNSGTDYDTVWSGPDVLNLWEYGGDPTGANPTATLAALNAMISDIIAAGGFKTLYIPDGNFKINGQPSTFSGVTNVTVCGNGWSSVLTSTVTGAAGNTFNFDNTCSQITMRDFALIGSATIRGSGCHIRMYASSNAEIRNLYISGCSDFGIHLSNAAGSSSTYSTGFSVVGCTIYATLGDGIHVGNVSDFNIEDNNLIYTGDDSIALVADNVGYGPMRGIVSGNEIYNGQIRGIAVLECTDITVEDNGINTTVAAGIELGRYTSTTAYNTRCKVLGNRCYNNNTTLGPLGAINAYFCSGCDVDDNKVDSPSTGSGIAYLDIQNTSISFNTIKNCPAYGIRGYTFSASNVATNWVGCFFKDNIIKGTTTNDGMLITGDAGKTLVDCFVEGNIGYSLGSGVFITYQQINPGRIYNNTSVSGTYVNGGSFTGTTGNNIS